MLGPEDLIFDPAAFSRDPDYILPPEEREKIISDYSRESSELKLAESEIKPVLAGSLRLNLDITRILYGEFPAGESDADQ